MVFASPLFLFLFLPLTLAAYFVVHGLERVWPGTRFVPRLVRVSAGIGAGLGVLAATAHFLHMDEFRVAMRRVLARLKISAG